MDLTAGSEQQRERLLVIDAEYNIESAGNKIDESLVELFCRDAQGNRRVIEVEGFRPNFFIHRDEFMEQAETLLSERRVLAVESNFTDDEWEELPGPEARTVDVYRNEVRETLEDDPLVKVYTRTPDDVAGDSGLRRHFKETKEADIQFVNRFLISSDIYRGISIPEGQERVRYENWDGHSSSSNRVKEVKPADPPEDVDPRILTVDIEVLTEGDGFPHPDDADKPVTAICAHDSYEDEYRAYLLEDDWGENFSVDGTEVPEGKREEFLEEYVERAFGIELTEMNIFEKEAFLLDKFNRYVANTTFDVLTGWNSDDFDLPYIIGRSYNIGAFSIRDWAYGDNDPFAITGQENSVNRPFIHGSVEFDMMTAYKKTQYHKLRSYSLGYVADKEVGIGKAEPPGEDLDESYHNHPVEFLAYNVRDVEAVVDIDKSGGVMAMFDKLREVTGGLYGTCLHNGPMLDVMFLRAAVDRGVALPTNTAPEQGNYHGAKVFEPVPGAHPNAIYPDLKSMYPFIMLSLNVSPETIVGTREQLEASQYTEEDCYRARFDSRGFKVVPEGETVPDDVDRDKYKAVVDEDDSLRTPPGMFDPQYDDLFFLKEDVKKGFISDTVEDLVDLKYQFSGLLYAAVKRVTNSCYGVLGDSASGGKGFRLFDHRLAEAVTMVGRQMITFTAEEYEKEMQNKGYEQAEIVGGDTDACICSCPTAESFQTLLNDAQEVGEMFSPDQDSMSKYDKWAHEDLNIIYGEDEHYFDVETESIANGIFFQQDPDANDPNKATKKRYAQHMVWDDDDGWIDTDYEDAPDDVNPLEDPWDQSEVKHMDNVSSADYGDNGPLSGDPKDDIGIKGFEVVRSDAATITKEAQMELFEAILLSENTEDDIYDYIDATYNEIRDGDVDLEKLGKPKGINNPLEDYGWKDHDELDEVEQTDKTEMHGGKYKYKASPAYRGAKYADEWLPWEEIGPGSKPVRLYVENVRPQETDLELPETYQYNKYNDDALEVDEVVNAISVDNIDRIPDAIKIDYDLMMEKELQGKVEPILNTIGMQWNGIVGQGRQTGLSAWG